MWQTWRHLRTQKGESPEDTQSQRQTKDLFLQVMEVLNFLDSTKGEEKETGVILCDDAVLFTRVYEAVSPLSLFEYFQKL